MTRSDVVIDWAAADGVRAGLVETLGALPRIRLTELPTPLHRLDRLPLDDEMWIKRDDLVSVALGGNKIRKLEFLAADAAAADADTIVTAGAGQSNSARCSAAAASMLGLDCHLVLGGDRPREPTANLLLDELFGAELHFAGSDRWEDLQDRAETLAAELRRHGRRLYVLPIGGSTPVGALGFVNAYLEIRSQFVQLDLNPSAIVLAVSSGATQAGLELARAILDDPVAIIGIGVAKTPGDLRVETTELLEGCAALLGYDLDKLDFQVTIADGYLGDAYAVPTAGGIESLTGLLQHEGILLDPVYTAKGFHGARTIDRSGLAPGPTVFWHTGGTPSFFTSEHARVHLGALDQTTRNEGNAQ